MGKVTESIWSNGKYIIPLADVQFIETLVDDKKTNRIYVVFKNSKLDEFSIWQPMIYLEDKNGESFKREFCRYRHELEFETLSNEN